MGSVKHNKLGARLSAWAKRMEYTVKDKARLEEYDARSDASEGSGERFFWRSGELLGRSLSSWLKLVLFYLLFCGILALLWGLCIGLMFQTVDFYIPKYVQDQGLIGSNPGLGFRPLGGLGLKQKNGFNGTGAAGQWSEPSVYSSLIWFRHGAGGNWGDMKASMDLFLRQYEPGYFPNQGASLTKCDFENTPLTPKYGSNLLEKQTYMNMIWLHCDGEDDPDIENIGPVTYTPFRGFPGYFYPYRSQRGYLSPIVMVQLKNPMPGVLMNLECTAWARNIERNRLARKGLVHFELIMD